MKYRRLAIQLAAIAVIGVALLAACGQADLVGGDSPATPQFQSQLPDFPLRETTVATPLTLTGNQVLEASDGASFNGNELVLPGTAGTVEHGLFRFGVGGDPTLDVSIDVADAAGSYFVGLADYAAGRWQISGPYSDDRMLPLAGGNYISMQGNAHIFIATFGGTSVTLRSMTLTVDGPIPTFDISGTITEQGGGLPGVMVDLTGDATAQLQTDASGNYTFSGVVNGNYTVTPSLAGYLFAPPATPVTVSNADATGVDFAGSPMTFTISGNITEGGNGLAGVTVDLSGPATAQVQTDDQGNYSFVGLANGVYFVTPSLASYGFVPASLMVNVLGSDQPGINFVGTPVPPTYSLSGHITEGASDLGGVTVDLSGAATGSVLTDANGDYSFSGLLAGDYTVTPSKANYSFTPPSNDVAVINADVPGVDFDGVADPTTFSISGHVTEGASDLGGVTVDLSGAATGSTTTDALGDYTFSGLPAGDYTVTPSMANYSFTPPNADVTVTNADVVDVDFDGVADPTTFTILGQIVDGAAIGMSGVTVDLTGTATDSTTTDINGNYSFTGVANGDYALTPTFSGWAFSPSSRAVTVAGADQPGQNFTGTDAPNYADVRSILERTGGLGCGGCHFGQGSGSVNFHTYAAITSDSPFGGQVYHRIIIRSVQTPWGGMPQDGGENWATPAEKALLQAWVDAGAPEF